MFRSLLLGALCAFSPFLPHTAGASDERVQTSHPYILTATAAIHRYGIWLVAPDHGCRPVRYVVSLHGRRLGFSAPLHAGQGEVVRIGKGFSAGLHALDITGLGCDRPPALARRVLLAKTSPDHSWLAQLP
jgi:hypothetical protein